MVIRTAAQDGALQGMKEICGYMGKSESTIIRYIKERDFPASKIGGEWVSDVALIADWRKRQIAK
jgi:predicted DNA-binding transcriptional regulator AlpA